MVSHDDVECERTFAGVSRKLSRHCSMVKIWSEVCVR